MTARRTLPSPSAARVVIGERHGEPRMHPSTAQAFAHERSRWLEHHQANTLRGALSRWVRSIMEGRRNG
jgi:hypothetical protein